MENREYMKTTEYILGLIESGKLKKGDRLPTERNISEELGTSRNSIREALRTLENLGLVESRQGSGNYLTDNAAGAISRSVNMMLLMNSASPGEICIFRRYTEKSICSYLIENICTLEWKSRILNAIEQLDHISDKDLLAKADKQFHDTLIHATENRFWILITEAVSEVYRTWIDNALSAASPDTIRQLQDTHRAIAQGIVEGNLTLCLEAVDGHYDIIDGILEDIEKLTI